MCDSALGEAVILTKFDWSGPAIHIEYCLTALANNVNVGWTVIVGVNDDT
jgi:hypothetical protein